MDLYVHFSIDLKYSLSYRVNSSTERQRTKLSSRSHRHRVLGFLLVAQTDRIPLRLSAKPTECRSYSYQFQICILLYHHELKRLLIQDFQKKTLTKNKSLRKKKSLPRKPTSFTRSLPCKPSTIRRSKPRDDYRTKSEPFQVTAAPSDNVRGGEQWQTMRDLSFPSILPPALPNRCNKETT